MRRKVHLALLVSTFKWIASEHPINSVPSSLTSQKMTFAAAIV